MAARVKKAPPRPPRKNAPRQNSAAKLQQRLDQQQHQLDVLIWLHAELAFALRRAAAQQMAAKMQPQIQEAIMQRMLNGAGHNPQLPV